MTLKQIKEFKLQMNMKGVREDKGEEVVDPFYITQVEAFPSLK